MSSRETLAHLASPDPTPEGEALYELMVQLPRLYFQLRSLPRRGASSIALGDGLWNLLRSLKLDGPRTVPQIARARDVARQRIQQLTEQALAEGFVELRENPDHRRSKIVALTREGEVAFAELDARLRRSAEALAGNMDVRDLDAALRVMFDLGLRLREGAG